MKKEIIALKKLGFALHLLHPKSKRPIDTGWSKSVPKVPEELLRDYRPGMNLGVRLGEASRIGGKYLAVIDCDVKSSEAHYQDEMQEALTVRFPLLNTKKVAIVQSGRGNGSRHIYALSDQPVMPKRLAQSPEKVRVHMPSVKPSKTETEILTAAELEAGFRLRAAWEISLMGEGQQVVLPPSLHPDTGRSYVWSSGMSPQNVEDFLVLPQGEYKESTTQSVKPLPFKLAPVDLLDGRLPDDLVDLIVSGKGCSDRSAGLLKVAHAMVAFKFTRDEILTTLSDPETYLGKAAYDHANSEERANAANWVDRFTLQKVYASQPRDSDFDLITDVAPLSEVEIVNQKEELLGGWESRLIVNKNTRLPINCLQNVYLVLTNTLGSGLFRHNEFGVVDEVWAKNPWDLSVGSEFNERAIADMKLWFSQVHKFQPSDDNLWGGITTIANKNKYHPIREYLDALPEWDRVPRVDNFLRDCMMGDAPDKYLRAISRKVLTALIARIYEPGIKFDYMLILEGSQGIRKSTAIKSLVGSKYFSDTDLKIGEKDAISDMRGKWVFEQAELNNLDKYDIATLKRFVSRDTDRMRPAYGRKSQDYPRQCIFLGSTNENIYLKDPSGNRRFWPFKVTGECNIDLVENNKEQILAEALMFYLVGEPLWLDDKEVQVEARDEQAGREAYDELSAVVSDWITKETLSPTVTPPIDFSRIRIVDLFVQNGPFAQAGMSSLKMDLHTQRRVADVLRYLGYHPKTARIGGIPTRIWQKDSLLKAVVGVTDV